MSRQVSWQSMLLSDVSPADRLSSSSAYEACILMPGTPRRVPAKRPPRVVGARRGQVGCFNRDFKGLGPTLEH